MAVPEPYGGITVDPFHHIQSRMFFFPCFSSSVFEKGVCQKKISARENTQFPVKPGRTQTREMVSQELSVFPCA
jgi:hypothetical protein